jgi:hypothetical protein
VRFHASRTQSVLVQVVECGPKLVANPEHLKLLREGVEGWNAWRTNDLIPDLREADLSGANLSGANLNGANLFRAALVETNLADAVLTGCRIYGISAWNVQVNTGTKQQDLIITVPDEPEVTVDNIEIAQFVYLLLHNEKIRDVIDTIGRKGGAAPRPLHRGQDRRPRSAPR